MTFELQIVTPYGEAFHGRVERVVLPGSEGEFGVLPHHERFLTPLKHGAARIDTGSEVLWAALAPGFADVSGEEVAVLVESCELAHEIDEARANLARDRAQQRLETIGRDEDVERFEEYEAALMRAQVRLSVRRQVGL